MDPLRNTRAGKSKTLTLKSICYLFLHKEGWSAEKKLFSLHGHHAGYQANCSKPKEDIAGLLGAFIMRGYLNAEEINRTSALIELVDSKESKYKRSNNQNDP